MRAASSAAILGGSVTTVSVHGRRSDCFLMRLLAGQGGVVRRGMDAVDVEALLLRNSEARRAYFRATEEGRRAMGFLVAMLVLAAYCGAFVVSMLCACNAPAECGCTRPTAALTEHSAWLRALAAGAGHEAIAATGYGRPPPSKSWRPRASHGRCRWS